MSGSIDIPVTASLDRGNTDAVLQQFQTSINKVGQAVAQANKLKYDPIGKTTVADLDKVAKGFEHLRKVSGDLNKRMKATGQQNASFTDVNWEALYPDQHSRGRQMHKAFEYVVGNRFMPMPAPGVQPGPAPSPMPAAPGRPGGANGPGGQVIPFPGRGIVGAGLNAMGGAGQVANSAISTGAAGGLGAGIAGFAGGIAALLIGKAIGAIKENVGKAENENVGYDNLKRALGDVNVGFNTLKESLRATANGLGMTYDDTQKLGVQFAKLSGLSGEQAKTLAEEVNVGGGAGRALGIDPATASAFFAQMRMSGATRDVQGSRELALMVGEAVAKSGASAKSEELLQAIAGYSASQARNAMSGGNTSAYAGMLTGMVGSKLPGMDPSNAASLLGRMNSAVAGGGNVGEAGQNFLYAALGRGGQLDPYQVKILQEQGMFGTGAAAFGAGSAYQLGGGRRTGLEGDQTTSYELMKRRFSGISGGNPMLQADMQSRFYGINMTQAMAMNGMEPAQLGGVQSRLSRLGVNLKDVNSTGISRMGAIEADGSLSSEEKDRRMREAASQGQEETDGKNIRDSKAALENIKVSLADKLIPLSQAMRDGIIFLAGGSGKMSTRQIQEAVLQGDSRDRREGIGEKYDGRLKAAQRESDRANKDVGVAVPGSPAHAAATARRDAADAEVKRLLQARDGELGEEQKRLGEEIKKLREAMELARNPTATGAGGTVDGRGESPRAGAWHGKSEGASDPKFDSLFKRVGAEQGVDWRVLKAMAVQESGLNPGAIGAANKNGSRDYGLMQHNDRFLAERGLTKESALDPEKAVPAAAKLYKQLLARHGSQHAAIKAYNGTGPAAEAHAQRVENILAQIPGTPMPAGAQEQRAAANQPQGVHGTLDANINLHMPGQQPQRIAVQTTLKPARAAGSW